MALFHNLNTLQYYRIIPNVIIGDTICHNDYYYYKVSSCGFESRNYEYNMYSYIPPVKNRFEIKNVRYKDVYSLIRNDLGNDNERGYDYEENT